MTAFLRAVLAFPIRVYRVALSPWLPPACRFTPSCSAYALEAVERHGLAGVVLGARRVARCHPGHPGGVDPVPDHVTGCGFGSLR